MIAASILVVIGCAWIWRKAREVYEEDNMMFEEIERQRETY